MNEKNGRKYKSALVICLFIYFLMSCFLPLYNPSSLSATTLATSSIYFCGLLKFVYFYELRSKRKTSVDLNSKLLLSPCMILLVLFVTAFNPSQRPQKHINDDFNHRVCATARIFVF